MAVSERLPDVFGAALGRNRRRFGRPGGREPTGRAADIFSSTRYPVPVPLPGTCTRVPGTRVLYASWNPEAGWSKVKTQNSKPFPTLASRCDSSLYP